MIYAGVTLLLLLLMLDAIVVNL